MSKTGTTEPPTADAPARRAAAKRRDPSQHRSRRSVRKILQATLEILAEDGLPGVNTNHIAQRAGVNVATLYAYFPDKIAILRQLADEFEHERGDYVAEHGLLLPRTEDWRAWFDETIDRLVRLRVEKPGGAALRRAIMSSPDLKPLDDASTERAIESNLPGIMAHGPSLDEAHARTVSRLVVVTITTVLDSAFATEPYDRSQVAELKTMTRNYLAAYLGQAPARPEQKPADAGESGT